jgi:hypothetical protein
MQHQATDLRAQTRWSNITSTFLECRSRSNQWRVTRTRALVDFAQILTFEPDLTLSAASGSVLPSVICRLSLDHPSVPLEEDQVQAEG